MNNFEQFATWGKLMTAKPDFEWNSDHHLFFFSSTHPALLPDGGEHVQVLCEMLVCDFDQKETVLICHCINEFVGGAIEAVPEIIKEHVVDAAQNEKSVYNGLFDYSSTEYLRDKYKDPKNIKDPSVVKRTLLYFDTVNKARDFVFEQVTQSLK